VDLLNHVQRSAEPAMRTTSPSSADPEPHEPMRRTRSSEPQVSGQLTIDLLSRPPLPMRPSRGTCRTGHGGPAASDRTVSPSRLTGGRPPVHGFESGRSRAGGADLVLAPLVPPRATAVAGNAWLRWDGSDRSGRCWRQGPAGATEIQTSPLPIVRSRWIRQQPGSSNRKPVPHSLPGRS
jgi:hypothetical protein